VFLDIKNSILLHNHRPEAKKEQKIISPLSSVLKKPLFPQNTGPDF